MSESGAGIALLKPRDATGNEDFLTGGGELGTLIRAYDWSATALGPLTHWPQSLKTATAILLRSPVPMVLLWGPEGIMIYNDAYAVFGGARHPRLLGSRVLEGWPEVADFNTHVMSVGLAGGTLAYRDQHLVLHRHGRAEDVWMNLDYSPVLDEAGHPAGVLAIVVETTERVLAAAQAREEERKRAESDARFRAFVAATSDAIFRMSPDWSEMRYLEGNRFIADTRAPSRDWIERYIPPPDQPQIRLAIQEMLRTRRCPSLEHRVVRIDGSLGWALSRAVPIEDAGGGIVEWFGTTSNITERKLAEAEIARAEERLRAEARQKDEFLAMLAHELRNPLAPITNASELLLHTVGDERRARPAIEMIRRQALHLTRLVDDLLDVSRITQGRIQLQHAPVNIAHAVAQAIETVEPQLNQKRLRLASTRSSHELYVQGDLARLIQCVVNLLGNAIKYTDPGGEIRIHTRAQSGLAIVEIADNGAGIAPELLPRIFDLFVQGERTLDRAEGGLGIGLSVVRRLIEMHKGEVIAASGGIGCGATFQIRLPLIERPQPQRVEPLQTETPPKRILIVDDNADAAESLAVLLGLQGHETRVALSGPEALETVETFGPDVALLDLGLPGMDGYQLAARLRATPRLEGVRLVALTGYGRSEDRERTQAAGFDDHLVKPVDLAALARALGRTR
jgi:signal transduction histidine kinase